VGGESELVTFTNSKLKLKIYFSFYCFPTSTYKCEFHLNTLLLYLIEIYNSCALVDI
jgi:hypothetical protein